MRAAWFSSSFQHSSHRDTAQKPLTHALLRPQPGLKPDSFAFGALHKQIARIIFQLILKTLSVTYFLHEGFETDRQVRKNMFTEIKATFTKGSKSPPKSTNKKGIPSRAFLFRDTAQGGQYMSREV